jgi:hypothetical protein
MSMLSCHEILRKKGSARVKPGLLRCVTWCSNLGPNSPDTRSGYIVYGHSLGMVPQFVVKTMSRFVFACWKGTMVESSVGKLSISRYIVGKYIIHTAQGYTCTRYEERQS